MQKSSVWVKSSTQFWKKGLPFVNGLKIVGLSSIQKLVGGKASVKENLLPSHKPWIYKKWGS